MAYGSAVNCSIGPTTTSTEPMRRLALALCVFTGLLSDPWAFWTSPVSLLRFINTPTEEHLQPLALHAHNADAKGTSHAHGETAESPFEDRY